MTYLLARRVLGRAPEQRHEHGEGVGLKRRIDQVGIGDHLTQLPERVGSDRPVQRARVDRPTRAECDDLPVPDHALQDGVGASVGPQVGDLVQKRPSPAGVEHRVNSAAQLLPVPLKIRPRHVFEPDLMLGMPARPGRHLGQQGNGSTLEDPVDPFAACSSGRAAGEEGFQLVRRRCRGHYAVDRFSLAQIYPSGAGQFRAGRPSRADREFPAALDPVQRDDWGIPLPREMDGTTSLPDSGRPHY
jgi:hypothetical protein